MPDLIKPTSDETRLTFLSMTTNANAADSGQYLSPDTMGLVHGALETMQAKMLNETGKLGTRVKETREKNAALQHLQVCMRDAWEVLKRRVYRRNEPADLFSDYQLSQDGSVPQYISDQEIIPLANSIIEGDAKAVARGYQPIQCPDVAELTAARDAALKEWGEVAEADRQLDIAENDLAIARQAADTAINEVVAELEFNLRKKEPASKRRIMRSYGATYRTAKGEPEEDMPTAVA